MNHEPLTIPVDSSAVATAEAPPRSLIDTVREMDGLPPRPRTYLNALDDFEVTAELIMNELEYAMEDAGEDRDLVFSDEWQETALYVGNNLGGYRQIFEVRPGPAKFAGLTNFYTKWLDCCEELSEVLLRFVADLRHSTVMITAIKLYEIYVLMAKLSSLTESRRIYRQTMIQ